MKNIYLIGAGGHCHSCIDVIEQEKMFNIKGIFDLQSRVGAQVLGYPVIGCDQDIFKYMAHDSYFLITLGQIKSAEKRKILFSSLLSSGAQLATVVSPRAWVSPHAKIGNGTIVMHDALVNANSSIGSNCIVNTKSLVEHDAIVGDHCHISTASVVNGNCVLESEVFVGSNSVIEQSAVIPIKTILQAGIFHRRKHHE